MLADAAHILVHVACGPCMTLSEVEIFMQELGRHVRDHTQILFGTAVDGRMGNRLSVTIISSLATEDEIASETISAPSEPFLAPPQPILEQPPEIPPKIDILSGRRSDTESSHAEAEPAETIPISENLAAFEEPTPIKTPQVEPKPEIKKPSPAPRLITPKKKPPPIKETKPPVEKIVQAKQEVLQFEPITRGRFEKSEPTIVEGQDLDVPTFLRQNIRVK
jgi:cell division protein FtsZ